MFARLIALSTLAATWATAAPLGLSDNFNAYIIHDYVARSADSEGSLVVGGNFSASSYGVNSHQTSPTGLVAGGTVSLSSGQIWGDAWSGGATTLSGAGVLGTLHSNAAADMGFLTDWSRYYTQLSGTLGSMRVTGSATRQSWGSLTLAGTPGAALQVFNITGSQLTGVNQFLFSGLTAGSQVLLNISGNAALSNLDMRSLGAYDVLFNFLDATSVDFTNTSPWADVLAPSATLTGKNGHIQGTLVAGGFDSTLELHTEKSTWLSPPKPVANAVPEPGALALTGIALLAWGVGARRQRRKSDQS